MIENIIILIILTVMIGSSITYIICAKKHGKKCIGCPESGTCTKGCQCSDK